MSENFTVNKITPINEQIAEELKKTRLHNNIKIEKVAEKLKINSKYLQILENGEFKKLPAGVYGRNFLREYALFLRLDVEYILQLFDNYIGKKNNQTPKNIFIKKTGNDHYFITIPKIIKNLLIGAIISIIITYLGFSINHIISAPKMRIITPEKDIITKERTILIKGISEPETKITINGETILAKADLTFEKTINLKQGINEIEIISQKKYSKQNIITRKILVK